VRGAVFRAAAASVAALGASLALSAADTTTIQVFLLERPVGQETYTLEEDASRVLLGSNLDFVDRGGRVQLTSSLRLDSDLTPEHFIAKGKTYRFVDVDLDVDVSARTARVRSLGTDVRVPLPSRFFLARAYAPFAAQALLVRYWEKHGKPAHLAVAPGAPTRDVRIEFRGTDTVRTGGREQQLSRYMIDGLVWGRETLWLDTEKRFAAVSTRVHILPLEAVRDDLRDALPELQAIAVSDRMADLASLASSTPAIADGTFALVGARLRDGTDGPAIEDAAVVIKDGRIVDAGPRGRVQLPKGARTIQAAGKTIVPGLWDMHGHVSQIEWAPAYLAAGVTTVRDMGGERRFLTAFRDALAEHRGVGPQLLLAGLVDGGGPDAFGTTIATDANAGGEIVDAYHAQGFKQMKLYGRMTADLVSAIAARAHEQGMTVTGHIPTGLSVQEAVEAGMDQIAHLPIRGEAGTPAVEQLIAFLARHRTAVDPTQAWNELLGRSTTTAVATFEPGILAAPDPLALNYGSVRNDASAAAVRDRQQRSLAIVKALHDAGVVVVAGTDGALPGHSLLREIELYAQAGFTPAAALAAATTASASAMRMLDDVGTIAPGKRADLLIVDADPTAAVSNIRKGRWVVAGGRMYDCSKLWRAAGFTP
jgi:imidazolonepropionase-like amidohydrolase